MSQMKNRPANRTANSNTSGDQPTVLNSIAGGPDFAMYERGFADGAEWADRTAEAQAELAARKFYAMETWEVDNRRRSKIDREWFDVERARAGQGVQS